MLTPAPARRSDPIALGALLAAAFDGVHPFADQWCQQYRDAVGKGMYGTHRVHLHDGSPVPVGGTPPPAWRTVSASAYGRLCAVRHVAAYTAVQTAAAVLLTRLLGVRVKPRSLAVGMLINAVTHAVIDRRAPLYALADLARKTGYIEHCGAVRQKPDGGFAVEQGGPGSAAFELDQALHRLIGVFAAAVTAWAATK